jgi:hypothetical protein
LPIKDEGHRNSMTTPELAERMRSWLITDYQASIFEDDTGILAYALYKEDQDRVHNSVAIAFWKSVGFTDYSLSLEIYQIQGRNMTSGMKPEHLETLQTSDIRLRKAVEGSSPWESVQP